MSETRKAWNSTLPAPKEPMKRSGPIGRGKKKEPRIEKEQPKDRPKLKPLSQVVKDLDKTAGAWATREGKCCAQGEAGIACGGRLDPAHVIKRGHKTIRHHPANILPVCRAHHDHFEDRLAEWEEFVTRLKGEHLLPMLKAEKNRKVADLRAMYAAYEGYYASLALDVSSDPWLDEREVA